MISSIDVHLLTLSAFLSMIVAVVVAIFDWESFGVLDRRSLMGAGRTWRFNCS